jgi:hypothetical protein
MDLMIALRFFSLGISFCMLAITYGLARVA